MRLRDTGSSSATRIRAFEGAPRGGSLGSGEGADEISEGNVNCISFSFKFREPFLGSAKIVFLAVLLQTQRQSPRPSRPENSEGAQQFVSARGQGRPIAFLHGLTDRLHNLRRVIMKNRDPLPHQFLIAVE